MRKTLPALWAMIRMAFRAHPAQATLASIVTVLFSLNYTLFALWSKLLVDSVVTQNAERLWVLVGITSLQMSSAIFMALTLMKSRIRLQERVRELVDRELMELTLSVPHIEHFERKDYLDQVEIVRSSKQALTMAVSAFVSNLGLITQMLGSGILLATLHPLLLVLPLFGLPSLFLGTRGERTWQKALENTAEKSRVARHFLDLSLSRSAGKELRIYRLGPELLKRHSALTLDIDEELDVASVKQTVLSGMGWIVFTAGYVAAIGFVLVEAISGRASLGDVLLAVVLCVQVNNQVAGVLTWTRWFLSAVKITERYLWLADYARSAREQVSGSKEAPGHIRHGIELKNVSFRYPGRDVEVLRDINLRFPPGSVVGLVGENGAGKTTLVKLLTRLYEPSSGQITIEGINLNEISLDKWRSTTATCFQDFSRFEFTIQESVGVGDLPRIEDPRAVESAVLRAGAQDTLATLPTGYRTQLGASWEAGVDLSEGQWQKIALARGFMRPRPIVLVLDEPTASLDPASEFAIFERFASAARETTSNGGITILVSHRFSTVSMADLIVVLDGGQVVELGTHQNLLSRHGLYAELFRIQAAAFR